MNGGLSMTLPSISEDDEEDLDEEDEAEQEKMPLSPPNSSPPMSLQTKLASNKEPGSPENGPRWDTICLRFNELMRKRCNSSALALELHLFWVNSLMKIYSLLFLKCFALGDYLSLVSNNVMCAFCRTSVKIVCFND